MWVVKMNRNEKIQFFNMAMELEPENLYCDGECSKAEARKRYNAIMKRWRDLEKKVKRKVTIREAISFNCEIFPFQDQF